MSEFYLLDLRHKPSWDKGQVADIGCPLMVWWGPNDSGYANSLAWAGKYSAERLRSQPDYYRLGDRMLAIPCEIAERYAVPKPAPGPKFGDVEAVRLKRR